jgi:hypothetical protein
MKIRNIAIMNTDSNKFNRNVVFLVLRTFESLKTLQCRTYSTCYKLKALALVPTPAVFENIIVSRTPKAGVLNTGRNINPVLIAALCELAVYSKSLEHWAIYRPLE